MKQYNVNFYKDHLLNTLLPFWENYGIDEECGGFYTCFTNDGSQMVSADKYTWSQGRMVWVLSQLVMKNLVSGTRKEKLHQYAKKGVEFLIKHSIQKDGTCVFLTDRCGQPQKVEGRLDASIYADCFVVLGLSAYAQMCKDEKVAEISYGLYRSIQQRYRDENYATLPYPIPQGLRAHGVPMILTNTAQYMAECLHILGDARAKVVEDENLYYARYTLDTFGSAGNVLQEFVPKVLVVEEKRPLLLRYINPGHTLEDLWFMLEPFRQAGDARRIEKCLAIMESTLQKGWDEKHGGLLLFADKEGGPPVGKGGPYGAEPMHEKVKKDWSTKLWWVHSEALYATLLASTFSDDEQWKAWYQKLFEYTFMTFPNIENERGEWIQIRDREGRPESRVVALPVKDPFHSMRNMIQIIELLENMKDEI